MTEVKQPIVLIITFLWIGFVCAISFMEAWLKFQAAGVTLAIGLGIGQLVFSTLNKIELLFSAVIILAIFQKKSEWFRLKNTLFGVAFLILMLQTFWLLPALDTRATAIIQGNYVSASSIHVYYVVGEVVKVVCLLFFGIKLFKKTDYGKSF